MRRTLADIKRHGTIVLRTIDAFNQETVGMSAEERQAVAADLAATTLSYLIIADEKAGERVLEDAKNRALIYEHDSATTH